MDINRALLVNSLRKLLSTMGCLSYDKKHRISIILLYVEGTSKKLPPILWPHKIRSTFYTENTSCKLLCKPKYRIDTEDKNNIVYEIDCSNLEQFASVNLNGPK